MKKNKLREIFHPDRLGFLIKLSTSKIKDYLVSLNVQRISNETYTSLRTFENYTYFNNSIGFPRNSYESIKFSIDRLNKLPFYLRLELDFFRKVIKDLESPFYDHITEFPIGEVEKEFLFKIKLSNFMGKTKYEFDYDLLYRPDLCNQGVVNNYEHNIKFTIQYYFYKLI